MLFDELRDSWANGDDAEGTPVDREQFADEGTHEVRDEADVWVYAGQEEGEELVLEANHESPRFAAVTAKDASMEFTNWGETELPEQPDESQLVTEQYLQQQMSGSTGSGAISGDSGSSDFDTEPTTPESTPDSAPTSGPNSSSNFESEGSYYGSAIVHIPDVGTFSCEGPLPGDPDFSGAKGNYTDADIQQIQDACNS
ncbi:MAG: hypothetical protein HLX51_13560 [Micrococcaceae bacterium]|nr:hypothetical protein [Micrococcaceae bacterium]